jgi:hypothetical protein
MKVKNGQCPDYASEETQLRSCQIAKEHLQKYIGIAHG